MPSIDTIFAPATPPGRSGVAVIRISGSGVLGVFEQLDIACPKARMATLCRPRHPETGDMIDEALALYFPAPASFTGEDVAEFHLHGSRAVMQEMISALSACDGLRIAQPGEFSRRAFMNAKMDLTQVEAVADLIDAQTAAQKKLALRQYQGSLADTCQILRDSIIGTRAHLEAYLDFPDEDIPPDVIAGLQNEMNTIAKHIRTLLGDRHVGEKIRDGLYVAIIGVPNAGKSTLLNAMTKRDIAIVSPEAGTTRDVLEVHLDLGGYPVTLADTAGLRETDGAVESEGIRRAYDRAEHADFRLVVIDTSLSLQTQQDVLSLIRADDVVVLNKIDLEPQYIDDLPPLPTAIPLSLATMTGMDILISQLKSRMEEHLTGGHDAVITRARHRVAFEAALRHVETGQTLTAPELCSEELRLASNALGEILGMIHVEDVLDKVFSSFCIGK